MVKFPIALNSYLIGLVDIRYIDVNKSIGKSIDESIGNTFLMTEVSLSILAIFSKSIVNNPDNHCL